jgi:hypothetical protein
MAAQTHSLSNRNQIVLWVAVAIVVLGIIYFTI